MKKALSTKITDGGGMIELKYKRAFVKVDYDFLRVALTQPESCMVEDVIANDDKTLTIYLRSCDETLSAGSGWVEDDKEPSEITIEDRRHPYKKLTIGSKVWETVLKVVAI